MLGSLLLPFLPTTSTPPPCAPPFSQSSAKCWPQQKLSFLTMSPKWEGCDMTHTFHISPFFLTVPTPRLFSLFHQTSVQNLWQCGPCLKCPCLAVSSPCWMYDWVLHGNPSFKCAVLFFPLTSPGNSSSSTSQTHFPDYPLPRRGAEDAENVVLQKGPDNGNHTSNLILVKTTP